jgi:hypothetical protein
VRAEASLDLHQGKRQRVVIKVATVQSGIGFRFLFLRVVVIEEYAARSAMGRVEIGGRPIRFGKSGAFRPAIPALGLPGRPCGSRLDPHPTVHPDLEARVQLWNNSGVQFGRIH